MNPKNIILGIGIVIVFALTLWQGIETFYPNPSYDKFCQPMRTAEFIDTQERCEALGGKWESYYPKTVDNLEGWCDRDYTCRQELEDAQKPYSRNLFIIALIVGVLAILVGFFLLSIEPVGSALIASGIWSFFYGTVNNWRNFTEIWRFILLAIVLVLLIWLALRAAKGIMPKQKKK